MVLIERTTVLAKKIGKLTGNKCFSVLTIMYDESRTYPYYTLESIYQSKTLKNLIKRANTYHFYEMIDKLTVYGVVKVPKSYGSVYTSYED
jgi:DNA/RNA endonuclease G (NUC1)